MESLFHFILLLTGHGPVILMYQIFLPAALQCGEKRSGNETTATLLLLFWGIKFKIAVNVLPMPYASVL